MLEIGQPVKLNAPMLEAHGATATVIQLHRNVDGEPVTAKVQIDSTGEIRWLHKASLEPIGEAA